MTTTKNVIDAISLTNEQMATVGSFRNFPVYVAGYEFRSKEGATLAYQAQNLGKAGLAEQAVSWLMKAIEVDREDNKLVRNHFAQRSLERIIKKAAA